LPAAKGGIVVEGRIPDASGQLAQEPGLTCDLCPPHDAAEVTLDEDPAAACRLLWQLLVNLLQDTKRDTPAACTAARSSSTMLGPLSRLPWAPGRGWRHPVASNRKAKLAGSTPYSSRARATQRSMVTAM
jgi:hypothetical protein